MKYLVVFLALLCINLFPVQAANLILSSDCQQSLENGVQVFVGYSADEDFSAVSQMELSAGASLNGDMPDTFTAGEHRQVFSIVLTNGAEAHWIVAGADVMNTLTIREDMDLPDCQTEAARQTVAIPLELTSDCAFVETKDYLDSTFTGHWSQVTSGGIPVLLHYGQALIGSTHQSADSADYRVVATPCF